MAASSMAELSWSSDDDGYRFPQVRVGSVVWAAYHSVGPDTWWIDGRLTHNGDFLMGVDLVATEKAYEYEPELAAYRDPARAMWDAGEVFAAGSKLAVPVADLSAGDTIATAVLRFLLPD